MGFGLAQSIWRALTGEVVQKIDVKLGNGVTVSMRLKRKSDGLYVVMACVAMGNYQFYPMDLGEFQAVTEAMIATRAAIGKLNNSD